MFRFEFTASINLIYIFPGSSADDVDNRGAAIAVTVIVIILVVAVLTAAAVLVIGKLIL